MKCTAQISLSNEKDPVWRDMSRKSDAVNAFDVMKAIFRFYPGEKVSGEISPVEIDLDTQSDDAAQLVISFNPAPVRGGRYVIILDDRYFKAFEDPTLTPEMRQEIINETTLVIDLKGSEQLKLYVRDLSMEEFE